MEKVNVNYVPNNEMEKSRQDHEYRMKQLDVELRKFKIQLDHEYRMKQLVCEKKK